MPDERKDIHELRLPISAFLQSSHTTAGCKAIAFLMAAAYACRAADVPHQVAAAMIADHIVRGDPI
jgi:hypothetical protein